MKLFGIHKAFTISDNSVTRSKIVNLEVTQDKIANNSINASKIMSNAITGIKINNYAVTSNKLANNAITSRTITDGEIRTSHIASSTIARSIIPSPTIHTSPSLTSRFYGNTTYQMVPTLSFNGTFSGRPVYIGLVAIHPESTRGTHIFGAGWIRIQAHNASMGIHILNEVHTDEWGIGGKAPTPSIIRYVGLLPAAGNWTISLWIKQRVMFAGNKFFIDDVKLITYEFY